MNRYSLRRIAGTGLACAALGVSALAVASPAGAADAGSGAKAGHHRLHLTDTQKQCLKDQGITRPVRPLTPEKIAALKAAAQACGIQRPNRDAAPQG